MDDVQLIVAECATAVLPPEPLNATVIVEFAALLPIARLPAFVPAAFGEYPTVKEALAPGAIVLGKVRPLTVKPVPDGVSDETTMLVPPLAAVP